MTFSRLRQPVICYISACCAGWRVRLECHGSRIGSDGGPLPFRELNETPGLLDIAGGPLGDPRTVHNRLHSVVGLLRQPVFGRSIDRGIDRAHAAMAPERTTPDMDGSVGPPHGAQTHGAQEGTAWNGHFGCMCHHPLFVLNRLGRLERRSLRPGNVHSADGRENVLKPVLARYADRELMRFFRADAAFAVPELYKTPEAEGCSCAIRPGKTAVPESRIAPVLKRPAGRPPTHVRRICGDFAYQAASRDKSWRVVAEVERHPGELAPRVGFIVTRLSRPARRVVAFCNRRCTAGQHIKDGRNAIVQTRLSCQRFRNNAVRL